MDYGVVHQNATNAAKISRSVIIGENCKVILMESDVFVFIFFSKYEWWNLHIGDAYLPDMHFEDDAHHELQFSCSNRSELSVVDLWCLGQVLKMW